MEFKRIKDNDIQTYQHYCDELEALVEQCAAAGEDELSNQEVQTLQLIVNDYDERHRLVSDQPTAPELIQIVMQTHGLKKNIEVARALGVGESLISQVLNYKKPVSKRLAKALSEKFHVDMNDLLKEYPLTGKSKASQPASMEDRSALLQRKNNIMRTMNNLRIELVRIDRILGL